jgi:hypothetical protein
MEAETPNGMEVGQQRDFPFVPSLARAISTREETMERRTFLSAAIGASFSLLFEFEGAFGGEMRK